MTRLGIIRVLSTEDADILESHGRLLERFISDPNLGVVSRCIQGHPQGLHSPQEEEAAVPKIVELGRMMEEDDDAASLLISCAADPGLMSLRAAVGVPVVGAGSASAAVALALGSPVGVLGITSYVLSPIADVLRDLLVGWEVPKGVHTTLDLMDERGLGHFADAGRRLQDRGAEVILLGCTGFSTVDAASVLGGCLGLPVIDPVLSAGLVAYYAAVGNGRRTGSG